MQVYNSYREYVEAKADYGLIVSEIPVEEIGEWKCLVVTGVYIYYKHHKTFDTTFIVQGVPRQETFVKLICNLLRFGNVELSTWETLDYKEVVEYIEKNAISNGQNIYLQVYTTLSGLKKCNTKYAIKVRADEWYKDFTGFMSVMKQSPDKITTHNMFFRPLGQYPYHISDHVIGGRTENLVKMFENCKTMLETKQSLPKIPRMLNHCPEQWLTVAYIKKFYSDDELLIVDDIKNKMIRHFQLVPINIFKDFIVHYTWKKVKYCINGPTEIKDHLHAFIMTNISEYLK